MFVLRGITSPCLAQLIIVSSQALFFGRISINYGMTFVIGIVGVFISGIYWATSAPALNV